MSFSPIVPESLFPRLKVDRGHIAYRQDLGRHMYGEQEQLVDPLEVPVTEPMLEDLQLQFVQDLESGFSLVRKGDCEGQEIWDKMALIQQAFRNLKDKLGEDLRADRLENGIFRFTSNGKYDASFLLLGNLWIQHADTYGENMYAAVPTHGLLLVGRQDDRLAILNLQEMIRAIFFDASRDHLLSKSIYQRLDGEWKIVATAF